MMTVVRLSSAFVDRGLPPRAALRLLHGAFFFRRPVQINALCRRRYGDAFTLWVPPWGDLVVFTDPADVKAVFAADTKDGSIDGGPAYGKVFELLMGTTSVLSTGGEEHLRLRRMMMKGLRGQKLEEHRVPIEEIVSQEIDRWPVGEKMLFEPAMQQLTLAIMLRDIVGVDDPAQEREIRRLMPQVVNVATLIQLQIAFPALRRLPWGKRYHATKSEARGVIKDVVRRRRAEPDVAERTDILSLLIGMTDEDGREPSDEELVDFLMTLLQAGIESTAAQMTWLVGCLLNHPHALGLVTDELREGREEYLEAAIKEALRLYPALPVIVREALTDVDINEHRVPKGTTICVSVSDVHRSPATYPDPMAFRPERFLDGAKQAPNTWVPWGGGRRRCAGQNFAMFEMQAVMATLFRRVELRPLRTRPDMPVAKAVVIVPRKRGEVVVTRRVVPVGEPHAPQVPAAV